MSQTKPTPAEIRDLIQTAIASTINSHTWPYGLLPLPGNCDCDYDLSDDVTRLYGSVELFGPEQKRGDRIERQQLSVSLDYIALDLDGRDLTELTPYINALAQVVVIRAQRAAVRHANTIAKGPEDDDG